MILPSPHWLPLLRAIGELKRVRSANQRGSIAERLFAQAWRRLVAGEDMDSVARDITARALVATQLGDLAMRSVYLLFSRGVAPKNIRKVTSIEKDRNAANKGSFNHLRIPMEKATLRPTYRRII